MRFSKKKRDFSIIRWLVEGKCARSENIFLKKLFLNSDKAQIRDTPDFTHNMSRDILYVIHGPSHFFYAAAHHKTTRSGRLLSYATTGPYVNPHTDGGLGQLRTDGG